MVVSQNLTDIAVRAKKSTPPTDKTVQTRLLVGLTITDKIQYGQKRADHPLVTKRWEVILVNLSKIKEQNEYVESR